MENKKPVFRVLCIDGGGARGLVAARILREIEERTGQPTCDNFDLIGGPSTGAILAAALSSGKFNAKEMEDYYYEHLPHIFWGSGKSQNIAMQALTTGSLYDPRPLDKVLDKAFGDMLLKDAKTNLVIPVADLENNRCVYLTHLKDHPDTSPEQWSTMKMRDAVRSSASAPVFFPATDSETTPDPANPERKMRHTLVDGGLFSGDIPYELLEMAKKLAPPDAEILFVHVGTGVPEYSKVASEFNSTNLVSRMGETAMLSINMATQASYDRIGKELGEFFYSLESKIYGPEGPGSKPPSLDNVKPEMLKFNSSIGEQIIEAKKDRLDRLCPILKEGKISLADYHQNTSETFTQLFEQLHTKDTLRGLAEFYQSLEKNDGYAAMPENEKASLLNAFNKSMKHVLESNPTLNALKEFGDNIIKNIPANDNGRRDKVQLKKKPRLVRIFNAIARACLRPFVDKHPEDKQADEAARKQKQSQKKNRQNKPGGPS